MKRNSLILLGLLTFSTCIAATIKSNWSRLYIVTNNCDQPLSIAHRPDSILYVILDTKKISVKEGVIRGCKYNLNLKVDSTRTEFENELIDNGFTIISSSSLDTEKPRSSNNSSTY